MNAPLTRQLAPSLLLALLACALGGLLLWAAQQAQSRARQENLLARGEAQALHQRHLETQQQEASLRASIARHAELTRAGLIGTEDRLSWVETLRSDATRLRLPAPEFSLAPQRQLPGLSGASDFRFQASQMKLGIDLLHEGDLLALLASLYQMPSVLVLPQSCSLRQLPPAGADGHAGLRADCQLDWITIAGPEQP